MASFHAKTGWKRPRKRKKKKLSFPSVPTRREIENSKKIAKKLKKEGKEIKQKLSLRFVPIRRVI